MYLGAEVDSWVSRRSESSVRIVIVYINGSNRLVKYFNWTRKSGFSTYAALVAVRIALLT